MVLSPTKLLLVGDLGLTGQVSERVQVSARVAGGVRQLRDLGIGLFRNVASDPVYLGVMGGEFELRVRSFSEPGRRVGFDLT